MGGSATEFRGRLSQILFSYQVRQKQWACGRLTLFKIYLEVNFRSGSEICYVLPHITFVQFRSNVNQTISSAILTWEPITTFVNRWKHGFITTYIDFIAQAGVSDSADSSSWFLKYEGGGLCGSCALCLSDKSASSMTSIFSEGLMFTCVGSLARISRTYD